jgi:conjugal transfer pilus assembly protein TraV
VMSNMRHKLLILVSLFSLGPFACGNPKYGCPYGEGATCKSVSRVYEESLSGELEKEKEVKKRLREIEESEKPRKLGVRGSELGIGKSLISKNDKTLDKFIQSLPNTQSLTFNPSIKSEKLDILPLRTPPEILRIWIAPWEDSSGALHSGSYIYLVVDSGKWILGTKDVVNYP